MMDVRIKLGMVGGGEGSFIGAVHRIASRIDDRYELVAASLSSDSDRAQRSAEALGINADRSYAGFEEMAAAEKQREDGIDVVSIVTPNHVHFPVAKAFLEQGIAVICDKPLCVSMDEALALQALLERSGTYFALTHNYTGYPLVRQAREMITSGELGSIRVIQVEYAQDWLTNKEEDTHNKQAEWRTDPAKSGPAGCLGDIGTHAYNLAGFMTGLGVSEVCADLHTFVAGRRLDDNVNVLLRYDNGAKGMLWSSQVAPGNENGLKIRIYGAKGGLEWAQENPNQLWYSPFGEPVQKLTRGGHGAREIANRVSRIPAGHPEGYLEGFANIYSDVADVLLQRQSGGNLPANHDLIPGIKEGVEGMQFMQSVLKSSSANGEWTPLISS